MKYIKYILLTLNLFIVGCVTYMPEPFVPYDVYDYPPPIASGRNNGPTSLRCIDNSNIFVHCNEAWWWSGNKLGWIPTGGGTYPWPRQIWTNKVYEIFQPRKGKPVPVAIYPY
jgi:hypothetical protein